MSLNNILLSIAVIVIVILLAKLIFCFFVYRVFREMANIEIKRQEKLQKAYKQEREESQARIRALFKCKEKGTANDETDTETDIPARRD